MIPTAGFASRAVLSRIATVAPPDDSVIVSVRLAARASAAANASTPRPQAIPVKKRLRPNLNNRLIRLLLVKIQTRCQSMAGREPSASGGRLGLGESFDIATCRPATRG